jgi:hypothetical protein
MKKSFNFKPLTYLLTSILVLSTLSLNATVYTNIESIEDNCGNKIVLQVVRTVTNVPYDCGKVKCIVQVTPLSGGQYIDEYDNIIWESGSAIQQIYDLNEEVFFFFPNNGIYNITFEFDVVTFCGTFNFQYDNYVTVYGCTEDNCTSSFSYCDFFLDPSIWDPYHQQPELIEFRYTDPDYGNQIINATNNPNGIFSFPYYSHEARVGCPDLRPNLFDFTADMNTFLNLSNSGNPGTENLFGTAEFHYLSLPTYCKRYMRFLSSGVFFTRLVFIHEDFPSCLPSGYINNGQDHNVWPTLDFPISNECLLPGQVNDIELKELLSDYENPSIQLTNTNKNKQPKNKYCYPSITSHNLMINNNDNSKIEISIFSISGHQLYSFLLFDNQKSIDISNFQNGLYFVRIQNKLTDKVNIEKIIKQ